MKQPFAGLKVLDLSRVLSGPFCTMNLGDLGAEVVKIEECKKGDDTRAFGPPFVDGLRGETPGDRESTYFLSINRNKKSVAVDLKSAEGRALVQRLADLSDVVVENFRPGVAARLGLDAPTLRARNQRLIYCSISGFGHEGDPAFTQLPGYDAIMQGLAGLQHVTGQSDGPPTRVGVPISDLLSGMTAFQSILVALYAREKTGAGATLDISMLDATAQVLTFHASSALNAKGTPRRLGNRHASIAPYETFQAADAFFNVAVGNDAQFVALSTLLGEPGWPQDPRFATNPERVKNRDALSPLLAKKFSDQPASHWVTALEAEGIPAGVIATVNEVVAHPQLRARRKITHVLHPSAGPLSFIGNPLPQAGDTSTPPPRLGEHTREVLSKWLQVSGAEVDRLAASQVLKVMP